MKYVAGLQNVDHSAIRVIGSLHLLDGMVQIRVERFSLGIDLLEALLRQSIFQLPVNQLKTLAVIFVASIAMSRQRPLESIKHGKQRFDQRLDAAMMLRLPLALDAFPVILKIGLPSHQR